MRSGSRHIGQQGPEGDRLGLMARVVMKFGGTSVANLERIHNVARLVKEQVDKGDQVAVVVSAMSGETNRLVGLCEEAFELYDAQEYDTVVSTGEQVTVGLLAIVLKKMGLNARSWLGWQMPFVTSRHHSRAQIEEIDGSDIIAGFEQGQVAVCAGFQGVTPDSRISTLGRGGSDTSAVALAIAVQADQCDIYTDVDGVYTSDPRVVPRARKIDRISHEEMLELASLGAKVLQTRSVSLAARYDMPLRVLSSLESKPGTTVCKEEDIMETKVVSGVAFSRDEAKITLVDIPDRPGIASSIFNTLGAINVDMIVQSRTETDDTTDMTFTVSRADYSRALEQLNSASEEIGFQQIDSDNAVCKVSIVGTGMKSATGVAQTMFRELAAKGINVQVISTSEIKISVLIAEEYLELAVRCLHTAFGLDAEEAVAAE